MGKKRRYKKGYVKVVKQIKSFYGNDFMVYYEPIKDERESYQKINDNFTKKKFRG